MSAASETEARARALFDVGRTGPLTSVGALTVAEGQCDGRALRVALTNRAVAGGSFGVDESELLTGCLLRSADDRMPVVLVLDSAGARLDAGLAGLGAFRRLYRAALDTRLAGVPMVAMMERDCFGGASMLAMLCTVRGAIETARLGMSGPAIVAALAGPQDLDASDRDAVRALFGAPARARVGAIDYIFDAHTPRRDVLARLLGLAGSQQADLGTQHRMLERRLRDSGVEPGTPAMPDAAAPFQRGQAVGAAELWRLSDALLACRPGQTVNLRIDCPGQAATRSDESLVLSEYVAHLALCLRDRGHHGVDIAICIDGQCAGGIYVALAAGAERVEATSAAKVRVLPERAIEIVLGRTLPDETLADALAAGIADRLIPEQRDDVAMAKHFGSSNE